MNKLNFKEMKKNLLFVVLCVFFCMDMAAQAADTEYGLLFNVPTTTNPGSTADITVPTGTPLANSSAVRRLISGNEIARNMQPRAAAAPRRAAPSRAIIFSFSEGFESTTGTPTASGVNPTYTPPLPTGWTLSNTGHNWGTTPNLADVPGCGDNFPPHTGTRMMYNTWSTSGDTWAFSPGFALTAGNTYTVSFWWNAMGWPAMNEPDNFEVRIGTSNTAVGMSGADLIFTHPNLLYHFDFIWREATATFTPTVSGTYHLGFHDLRAAGTGLAILIDDIEVTSGVADPITVTGVTATKVYDGNDVFNDMHVNITAATLTGVAPGDVVTLSVAAGTVGAFGPNAGAGTLVLTGTPFSLSGADAGKYTLSAQPTVAATITKANSATALISSPNPSVIGQSVTFTATVTGAGATPTGSVEFYDGATLLGTATLAAGVATFTISTLSAGSHSITAHYAGNLNYNTSVSSAVNQVVDNLIEIIVTANSGSSKYGETSYNPGITAVNTATGEIIRTVYGLYNNFYITPDLAPGAYLLKVEGTLASINYVIKERISGIWNVFKADGANLSGAPAVTGTPTSTVVTVSAVSIPVNPGNQKVEYAIATSDGLEGWSLDALAWQSGTTFTGDFPAGTYYVYARSAENTYYAAGVAQVSSAFTIVVTGIDVPAKADALFAWVENGTLHVSGLAVGKPWSVYNLAGMLLYQAVATENVETLRATSVQNGNLYIIRSDGRAVKVLF